MARLTEHELETILATEIAWYAGISDDSEAYLLHNDDLKHYAVNGVMYEPRPNRAFVIMEAHIESQHIVVDHDSVWDKQLWKALVAAGVPREQIVLAYQGEKIPQASET